MSKRWMAYAAGIVVGAVLVTARLIAQPSAVKPAQTPTAPAPEVSVVKVPAQVVLYTIYRGDYAQVGPAIGKLFALAGQKGLMPRGPAAMTYLNNPQLVSKEHWLTEIRIPVGEEALSQAGKLGEMTDVKRLPALEAARVTKAAGVADPAPLYEALDTWVSRNGYLGIDGPMEICEGGATGQSYAQMQCQILLPVKKAAAEKRD